MPKKGKTASYQEFTKVLNEVKVLGLKSYASTTRILVAVGYSNTVGHNWRNCGEVPEVAFWAVKGLLAQLQEGFTQDEIKQITVLAASADNKILALKCMDLWGRSDE